jgi:hypothetical protein
MRYLMFAVWTVEPDYGTIGIWVVGILISAPESGLLDQLQISLAGFPNL